MFAKVRASPHPLLLVVAAGCVGFGDFYAYGAYTPRSLRLVAIGCLVVAAAMALPEGGRRVSPLVPQVAVVVLVVWQGLVPIRATIIYGHGHALALTRYIAIALPLLAAAAVLTSDRAGDWWWRSLVVGFGIGAVATIHASPRPAIDVWYLLQHSTHCLPPGCNFYMMTTPDAPGLRDGFPYLPMTAVLLAPFRVLFSDVRYGEAAAIIVAALVLRRCGTGRVLRLSPLFLCVPGLLFQVEQAWTESVLVVLLVAAAAVALRGRGGSRSWIVSGLLIGVALATKQHMWLLLPVVWATLGWRPTAVAAGTGAVLVSPWFLADPSALWHNTVTNFTRLAPRVDALTFWLHEPARARTVLAMIVLSAAYALVWLACRSLPHRFLLGSAAVLAAFDLMNKQSFYNQWVLITWLLIAAAALELDRPLVNRFVS